MERVFRKAEFAKRFVARLFMYFLCSLKSNFFNSDFFFSEEDRCILLNIIHKIQWESKDCFLHICDILSGINQAHINAAAFMLFFGKSHRYVFPLKVSTTRCLCPGANTKICMLLLHPVISYLIADHGLWCKEASPCAFLTQWLILKVSLFLSSRGLPLFCTLILLSENYVT